MRVRERVCVSLCLCARVCVRVFVCVHVCVLIRLYRLFHFEKESNRFNRCRIRGAFFLKKGFLLN